MSSLDDSEHLQILYLPTSELKPDPRNPRVHPPRQIKQIARWIAETGFNHPIQIDGEKRILAGHGRLAAAKLLGLRVVPTVYVTGLTEAQYRAYAIADNQLALKAEWNKSLLAIELTSIIEIGEVDIESTGFEMAEVDLVIEAAREKPKDASSESVELPCNTAAVSSEGDLWLLGKHRLLCGNSLVDDSYHLLMEKERARVVFTDPPYNVPISGHVSGLGVTKHREFAMAVGEMSEAEFVAFLDRFMERAVAYSLSGALHYICMDWRHLFELLTASRRHYGEHKNLCVWNKSNGGMGSMYRSKHELVAVFKVGTAPHINNVELGVHGRNRTNVWEYAGVNTFRAGRMDDLSVHPTVKPVDLVADVILDASKRGDVILDPFVGSGTTIIAAERVGRRAFALELDPVYVDTAIRRWQAYTGDSARNSVTGATFAETAEACRPSAGSCSSERAK